MDWRQILQSAMANPVMPPLQANVPAPNYPPGMQQRVPQFASPPMMGRFSQLAYGMSGVPTGVQGTGGGQLPLPTPIAPPPQIPTPIGPPMTDPTDILRRLGGGGGLMDRTPFPRRIR